MADDQTNPFTMMGMMGMMQPNKYVDPAYKDKPLSIPGFLGTPTDALGNPIKSFTDAQAQHDAWDKANPAPTPGTTLNSAPQSPVDPGMYGAPSASELATRFPGVNATPEQRAQAVQANAAHQARINPGPSAYYAQGNSGFGSNQYANANPPWVPFAQGSVGAQGAQGQGPAAAPAPTNPVDMRQAYLTALSNPGKVTTPGASVPQAAPLGQPSVMDSFLAAHPSGGGAGAGNYNNTGFFDTLNKLRSA